MLRRLDFRGHTYTGAELKKALPRGEATLDNVVDQVAPIVHTVASQGASAALDFGETFDKVRPETVRVPAQALVDALRQLDPVVREALELSIQRARTVQQGIMPQSHTSEVTPGGVVSTRWSPVQRVGLYVPGGRAVYPSSVIMNVVPAQVAGVKSLVVATPPQQEHGGLPHPTILAACQLLGIEEVWAVGGAQSIALLAHGGTDTDGAALDPVDVITGPGNIFVTAAKRLVRSIVGIDSEAGPTEIAILADDTADVEHVVADLISQAEHDEMAGAVLITDSTALAAHVEKLINLRTSTTHHVGRVTAALSGSQSAIVIVDDLEQGLHVVNAYAAEHLEIHTREAAQVAQRVVNAGAIFIGSYSPVSLGDYAAGSNHVLPTAGSARYSSGLNVFAFLKAIEVIEYTQQALQDCAEPVMALARDEQLPAHAEAIAVRLDESTRE